MTFYETLSELMDRKTVSKKQLAEILQIGKNQFKYWETKGNIPNGETLIALSDYFNCSVDYLLGREETKKAAVLPVESSDINKLIGFYNQLTEEAQKEMLSYAEYMTTKPDNLRSSDENKRAV